MINETRDMQEMVRKRGEEEGVVELANNTSLRPLDG